MIKNLNLIIKPKNLFAIISPHNIEIIEIKKVKNSYQIFKINEFNKNFFYDSSLIKENFDEILKFLNSHYPYQKINIVFNIPKFFVQKFNLPNIDQAKDKNVVENKIKEELPISLERYFWKLYINPNLYENLMIIFYQKEIIETIINQLMTYNILPLEVQPLFSPLLSFTKEKFALSFEKSYLVLIVYKEVLTVLTYENGFITNIFSEQIESSNLKELSERLINSSLRLLVSPLDIIFILSDQDLNLDFIDNKEIKIIEINKSYKLSIPEIIANEILNHSKKDFLANFSLNIYNLEKEIILHNANYYLKMPIILTLILGVLVNSSLFIINNYLNKTKKNLTDELSLIKSYSYDLDDIKKAIALLNEKNNKLKIYDYVETLNYLSKYKINGFTFNKNEMAIILEDNTDQIKEEILNFLKNSLKLNEQQIMFDNNLIKINLLK
jgi:hypothetical protein